MLTLVTGASGHIGGAICRQLAGAGRKVRAMVRTESNLSGLCGPDGMLLPEIEIAYADILDAPAVAKAVSGCEIIYHTAAIFKTRLKDESLMMRTNVEGTRILLTAAAESQPAVKRILYTSSVAAIGCSRQPSTILTEATWNTDPIDTYVASKTASEKLAHELMKTYALPIVFLNPATVIGRGDYSPTPSNGFLLLAMQKPTPVYFAGGHSYTHADAVAAAHIAAETKGKIGERYILAGENISMEHLFAAICRLTGGRKPLFRIGHLFVSIAGLVFETLSFLTGKPALFTRKKAHKLIDYYGYFDSSKAQRDLAYEAPQLSTLLPQCHQWFRERGWL